jgi:hypothetical protein
MNAQSTTLRNDQIAEIKKFISKKGIQYIDVQMEIIDHTASAVEERMSENKNLTFEQALKQTHASFGVFGFGSIEDSIVNGIGRRYRKVFWSNFLSFFGLKYIAILFFGGFLSYQAQLLVNDQAQGLIFFLLAAITLLIFFGLLSMNFKRYKQFMVYRIANSFLMFVGAFIQIFNLLVHRNSSATFFGVHQNYAIASFVLVLYVVYLLSAVKTATAGIKESKLLVEKYSLVNI